MKQLIEPVVCCVLLRACGGCLTWHSRCPSATVIAICFSKPLTAHCLAASIVSQRGLCLGGGQGALRGVRAHAGGGPIKGEPSVLRLSYLRKMEALGACDAALQVRHPYHRPPSHLTTTMLVVSHQSSVSVLVVPRSKIKRPPADNNCLCCAAAPGVCPRQESQPAADGHLGAINAVSNKNHSYIPSGVRARQEARPAADGHPGRRQPLCRDPGGGGHLRQGGGQEDGHRPRKPAFCL